MAIGRLESYSSGFCNIYRKTPNIQCYTHVGVGQKLNQLFTINLSVLQIKIYYAFKINLLDERIQQSQEKTVNTQSIDVIDIIIIE